MSQSNSRYGQFGLDSEEMKAYDTYLELTFEEGIKPVNQEMIVHYGEQYGTLDMIANWNGVLSLGDIKNNYTSSIQSICLGKCV